MDDLVLYDLSDTESLQPSPDVCQRAKMAFGDMGASHKKRDDDPCNSAPSEKVPQVWVPPGDWHERWQRMTDKEKLTMLPPRVESARTRITSARKARASSRAEPGLQQPRIRSGRNRVARRTQPAAGGAAREPPILE